MSDLETRRGQTFRPLDTYYNAPIMNNLGSNAMAGLYITECIQLVRN